MLPIFALAYVLIPADLPVVMVRPTKTTVTAQTTLEELAADLTMDDQIVVMSCNFSLRRTVPTAVTSVLQSKQDLYVFQNSSVIYEKIDALNCTEANEITEITRCGIAAVTEENFDQV